MSAWRNVSLWMDQVDEPLIPRAPLIGAQEADVVIIGAGYTGLWTAYYLKRQAPELRVVIVEANISGFGASGRNGGWLMGAMLGEDRLLADLSPAARHESHELLHGIPDEVATVLQREGIDCDYRKAGVLYTAARYPEQETSLREQLRGLHAQGHTEADYRWLSVNELNEQLRVATPYGAIFTPHCATIQPAKLVRGLARTVERMGVQLFEQSAVTQWYPGVVRTAQGEVRAEWVVPAIEGYSVTLPPLGNHLLPVQSLIVATAPLPASTWAEIGLERGQAFSEASRQVTYGQRTMDDRLVFGARGGYKFGGKLRPDANLTDDEVSLRRYLFGELFPMLKKVPITHSWGGNLGMSRSFHPTMLCDRKNQVALAGGYGGEGVGASNLGGRTVAQLILGETSALTRQPWVQQDSSIKQGLRTWEPEPCRWLGYNAIIKSFVHEDQVLANPVSAPWRRRFACGLAGFMESFMK
ncbi:NAD(P)/FAD-dependent oxidoreductase [Pseudomonas turukhanskensis]|uniref:FAD dependent oxidoreductase domain-containing protein n=1 Tax=Pseudomonas turukhanskensis TaxID=1806536 RepID=A0A9W6K6Y0_9PSED|nr:FAD-dependent oxidoreductase [Pseudomonas turukhanskensis]GLK88820.1 hypothetical protein GCM10017655_18820 [Pseudomonas turukhanskensis]